MDATAPDALLYSGRFGNLIPRLNPNRTADLAEKAKNNPDPDYVYALVDPRDDRVRYIGLTRNPLNRLRHHTYYAHTPAIAEWIAGLRAEKKRPRVVILAETHCLTTSKYLEERAIAEYEGFHGGLLNGRMEYAGTTRESRKKTVPITDAGLRRSLIASAVVLYPCQIPAHSQDVLNFPILPSHAEALG